MSHLALLLLLQQGGHGEVVLDQHLRAFVVVVQHVLLLPEDRGLVAPKSEEVGLDHLLRHHQALLEVLAAVSGLAGDQAVLDPVLVDPEPLVELELFQGLLSRREGLKLEEKPLSLLVLLAIEGHVAEDLHVLDPAAVFEQTLHQLRS